MSYVDVETSAEAIQEDEELIEAMEHIVEKAAEAIYADFKNNVSDFYVRFQYYIEKFFPFWIYWRDDKSLFWADMEKMAISFVLFVIASWILAPSSRWINNSSSWFGFRKTGAGFGSKRSSLSPFGTGTDSCKRASFERSRSTSSINYSLNDRGAEYEEGREETQEGKFAKRWISILETNYSCLVLPPECKRVDKTRHIPKTEKKEEKKSEETEKENDDEENPARRLVIYTRNFLHLIMSFLRYDYVGAGWTLIHWIDACLRSRRDRGNPDNDEVEDDESDASSLVRRLSYTSQTSTNSAPKEAPRHIGRSKRDSILKRGKIQQISDALKKENDFGSSSESSDQGHASLTIEHSMSDEAEEKKDAGSEIGESCIETPPNTPRARSDLPRHNSSSSLYETPILDLREELDPGDILAAKLALSTRLPSIGVKTKDALESYRLAKTRKGAPLFPPSPQMRRQDNPIHEAGFRLQERRSSDRSESGSAYYFNTVSTNEHLQKMNVEVPVPDKNGYILGDEFLPGIDSTPLLVFVNSRSGPQQGHLLITQLRGLLNPIQIWDLADGGPEDVLESFSALTRLRILVCGGDGTVSWIVSTIEKMGLHRWPPIAILPLGTGNDLARIHGWGGGYNNESLVGILEQVAESYISWLDRWEMTIENKKGKVKEVKSFFNYLGVGADAQTALQVHLLRESRPQLFFSRVVNKAWYGIFGAEDVLKATSINLPQEITLFADGVEVPLPADSQGIIFLNIDSYAGGVPMWSKGGSESNSPMGSRENSLHSIPLKRSKSLDAIRGIKGRAKSSAPMQTQLERMDSVEDIASMALTDEEKYSRVTACERPSSCQDGLLDIVSVRGVFHLGQIRVGLSNAQKLCQCREVTIIIKRKVSVQIDGEPWRQNVCTLRVKRKKEAAIMLHRSEGDSNGVETEMAKLLDWAEDRKLINNKIHGALMKEFSRRIESKTRQRRVTRSQDNMMFSLKRAMGSTGNLGLQKGGTPTGLMF